MHEFWQHYIGITLDPAHLAAELTFIVLVDVLILGMVWPFLRMMMKKYAHKEHLKIDKEHGVEHE